MLDLFAFAGYPSEHGESALEDVWFRVEVGAVAYEGEGWIGSCAGGSRPDDLFDCVLQPSECRFIDHGGFATVEAKGEYGGAYKKCFFSQW